MERVLIAAAIVVVAVVVALVARRRRPDPPTQPGRAIPAQLDRHDFERPDAAWLVAVFTSATCDSCADVVSKAAVLASVAKTGRLLVAHEAIRVAGFGAEIAATVAEETGAKVARLGAPRIPVGYAPTLEAEARVSAAQVAAAAQKLAA